MSHSKRRFFRLPLESRVFIELEAPPPGRRGPVKVARCDTEEVSLAGLRVRVIEAVTVGAILQVGVELPGKAEPFYLVGQVRWQRRDTEVDDAWVVGLEILNAHGSDIEQWQAALEVMDERISHP